MTRFAAVEGATLTGPTMVRLTCSCIVDDSGAIWSPCPTIWPTHTRAVELARLGMTAGGLADLLDAMRAHVAANPPAVVADQAGLF